MMGSKGMLWLGARSRTVTAGAANRKVRASDSGNACWTFGRGTFIVLSLAFTIAAAAGQGIDVGDQIGSGTPACPNSDIKLELKGDDYSASGTVMITIKGPVVWCRGALHTWLGGSHAVSTRAIRTIESDAQNPLQFRIEENSSYRYLKGRGSITMRDGSLVKYPQTESPSPSSQAAPQAKGGQSGSTALAAPPDSVRSGALQPKASRVGERFEPEKRGSPPSAVSPGGAGPTGSAESRLEKPNTRQDVAGKTSASAPWLRSADAGSDWEVLSDRASKLDLFPQGMAFSPDGRYLAIAGSQAMKVERDGDKVRMGISFGPGNDQGKIVVLDAKTLRVQKTLGTGVSPGKLAFSADGKLLSGLVNGMVESWAVASGDRVSRTGTGIDTVAFSPNGAIAIAVRETQQIIDVMDLRKSAVIASFPMPAKEGKAVTTGQDHFFVYVKDGSIKLRNLASGSELAIVATESKLSAAVVSPDESTIAVGTDKGLVVVFTLTGQYRAIPKVLDSRVNSLCFSGDGGAVGYVTPSASLVVWRIAEGKLVLTLGKDSMPISECAWAPTGGSLVSGQIDGGLRLWRVHGEAIATKGFGLDDADPAASVSRQERGGGRTASSDVAAETTGSSGNPISSLVSGVGGFLGKIFGGGGGQQTESSSRESAAPRTGGKDAEDRKAGKPIEPVAGDRRNTELLDSSPGPRQDRQSDVLRNRAGPIEADCVKLEGVPVARESTANLAYIGDSMEINDARYQDLERSVVFFEIAARSNGCGQVGFSKASLPVLGNLRTDKKCRPLFAFTGALEGVRAFHGEATNGVTYLSTLAYDASGNPREPKINPSVTVQPAGGGKVFVTTSAAALDPHRTKTSAPGVAVNLDLDEKLAITFKNRLSGLLGVVLNCKREDIMR